MDCPRILLAMRLMKHCSKSTHDVYNGLGGQNPNSQISEHTMGPQKNDPKNARNQKMAKIKHIMDLIKKNVLRPPKICLK